MIVFFGQINFLAINNDTETQSSIPNRVFDYGYASNTGNGFEQST